MKLGEILLKQKLERTKKEMAKEREVAKKNQIYYAKKLFSALKKEVETAVRRNREIKPVKIFDCLYDPFFCSQPKHARLDHVKKLLSMPERYFHKEYLEFKAWLDENDLDFQVNYDDSDDGLDSDYQELAVEIIHKIPEPIFD